MKKVWMLLLCAVLALGLAACGGDKKEEAQTSDYTYEIAFLTPSTEISIDDEDRMEAVWNGVRQFAEENGKTYSIDYFYANWPENIENHMDLDVYYIEYKIIPKQAELKISAMGDAPVCFWVFMTN